MVLTDATHNFKCNFTNNDDIFVKRSMIDNQFLIFCESNKCSSLWRDFLKQWNVDEWNWFYCYSSKRNFNWDSLSSLLLSRTTEHPFVHKHIIHSEGLEESKLLCTRIWSLKYMKHLKQMKPMRQTMPTMTCIPRGASQRLSSLRWTNIPNWVLIKFPKNTNEFIRKSNTATRGKLPPHPNESFMDV